jgi:hypothetical protein
MLPETLYIHFQEYDPTSLDLQNDADLIIQRTLEFGEWEEVRWLLKQYGQKRLRAFLVENGERWLRPPTFNYWRKLFGVRRWKHSPFPIKKGELWNF